MLAELKDLVEKGLFTQVRRIRLNDNTALIYVTVRSQADYEKAHFV